jgi:hypothetical protein
MLPKFLYGTFKRYKDDTDAFVKYIVDKAKKCGHEIKLQQAGHGPKATSGKKAFKATRKDVSQKITLKDLKNLANTIVESNIQVSPVIVATARRAISLRKRCANWFSSNENTSKKRNATHSHFIEVLEELCDLLECKIYQRPTTTDHVPPASGEKHAVKSERGILEGNRFAELDLHEAEVVVEEEMETATTTGPQVQIEEEDEDDDGPYSMLFFTLYCLFEDLQNMRNFLHQTITEYKEGKIDLVNLAVVADTAVHLSKQLIEEAMAACPELTQQQQQLQEFMYVFACVHRGEDPGHRPSPDIPYNTNMADVADWCYLPTSILLLSFRDVLQPRGLPVFKKGHFGFYDPTANRERMSAAQRFNEDKIILLELLPEFAQIQRLKIQLPVQDDITREMVRFVETKEVPLSLCFAAQILLDVHHGLREKKDKAFNDLRFCGIRMTKTIEEYWEFERTFSDKAPFWSDDAVKVVKEQYDMVKRWTVDDVSKQ